MWASAGLIVLLVAEVSTTSVSLVGDSITAGICAGDGGGYDKFLQKLLPSSWTVNTFGNSGKTMLKNGANNQSYWDTDTFQKALNSTPDIVTIMLGTNDAKQENWIGVQAQGDSFEADYRAMITRFASLPSKPKIIVAVPPPLFQPFPYRMNASVINSVLPQLLRKIARESEAEDMVIDVHTKFSSEKSQVCSTCDGCHPNGDQSYEMVAEAFSTVLSPTAPTPAPSPTPAGPTGPAGGVWLYKTQSSSDSTQEAAPSVFLNFSWFYSNKGPTCIPGNASVTWNGCYAVDSMQAPVLFGDGTAPWDTKGSHIAAIRVVGAQGVSVGNSCFGPSTSAPITAANGTVSLDGPLHFETPMPPQWVDQCCIPYHIDGQDQF
jgi:lysophospholipase L1-like esterase